MTIKASVEDILRPLAESTVVCPQCGGTRHHLHIMELNVGETGWSHKCEDCSDGRIPDPRFEALRRTKTTGYALGNTYTFQVDEVDASLGAIVRAAAACGWYAAFAEGDRPGEWVAFLHSEDAQVGDAEGATPEEAAALALVAAVGDEIPLYQSSNIVIDDWKSPGQIVSEAENS